MKIKIIQGLALTMLLNFATIYHVLGLDEIGSPKKIPNEQTSLNAYTQWVSISEL